MYELLVAPGKIGIQRPDGTPLYLIEDTAANRELIATILQNLNDPDFDPGD
jgi:hypothetical protein